MAACDPVPRVSTSARPRPVVAAEVENLGPGLEQFEGLVGDSLASFHGLADGAGGVLPGVLLEPREYVGGALVDGVGVVAAFDEAELEGFVVPVGVSLLEAADV